MKILIAGGSGMIGNAVAESARAGGHTVEITSVPRPPRHRAQEPPEWDAALATWTPENFADYDAVMFFGGEAINSRWTTAKQQRIILSRQEPCHHIARCLACLGQSRPGVVISASATGFYGSRGEAELTEQSSIGTGFLPPTTHDWEQAWEPAIQAGVRVVALRLGVVLSPQGGALKMMLPAYKFGLGGPMGTGQQWMPWISLSDSGRLAVHCAENPNLSGAVNAVAPVPVRQADFARVLGKVLNRPAVLPAPAFALKLAFGQMAEETVLSSCKAVPARALETGFKFQHPDVESALAALL